MNTWLRKAVLFSMVLAVSTVRAQETSKPDVTRLGASGFYKLSVADFAKLRMTYAEREDFTPRWEDHADREKITDFWDEDKVDEGMKLAKAWLEKHPVDGKMHMWYAFFLKEKGDMRGYFKHMHFYYGLLASIADSGTGRTADSPMSVISVAEEYTLLRSLGAEVKQQSIQANKARVLRDRMECEVDGKELTLYFDVTIPMASTRKILRGADHEKTDPPMQQK